MEKMIHLANRTRVRSARYARYLYPVLFILLDYIAILLAEQEANLQEVAKAQGMDEAQVDFWRRKFLGIGA